MTQSSAYENLYNAITTALQSAIEAGVPVDNCKLALHTARSDLVSAGAAAQLHHIPPGEVIAAILGQCGRDLSRCSDQLEETEANAPRVPA